MRFPGSEIALPPLLFPPAGYYAAMARHERAIVDCNARYDKRLKGTHRFEIADTRGRLALTVPIVKPDFASRPTWADVRISRHGDWWDKHLTALESAYGRTPYFEFYIDRLLPLFSRDTPVRFPTVIDMVKEANRQVCDMLGLNYPIVDQAPVSAAESANSCAYAVPAYHQIRERELGFIAGLSVLDLLFNLGPEAPLILDKYDN